MSQETKITYDPSRFLILPQADQRGVKERER